MFCATFPFKLSHQFLMAARARLPNLCRRRRDILVTQNLVASLALCHKLLRRERVSWEGEKHQEMSQSLTPEDAPRAASRSVDEEPSSSSTSKVLGAEAREAISCPICHKEFSDVVESHQAPVIWTTCHSVCKFCAFKVQKGIVPMSRCFDGGCTSLPSDDDVSRVPPMYLPRQIILLMLSCYNLLFSHILIVHYFNRFSLRRTEWQAKYPDRNGLADKHSVLRCHFDSSSYMRKIRATTSTSVSATLSYNRKCST